MTARKGGLFSLTFYLIERIINEDGLEGFV